MILSKGDYARSIGVKPSTISQYIRRGRLRFPALTLNGKIDSDLADRQLAASLDPLKSLMARVRYGKGPVIDAATDFDFARLEADFVANLAILTQ